MDANNDSGGGMMPTEQWVTNEIKALEQAHAELAAKVEQMISKACQDCAVCEGRGWSINVPSQSMYPCRWCGGSGKRSTIEIASLESPAPAPDPVCANCEHPANDHHSLCWHRLDSGDVCGCKAFVPTAGPAPLDPVRMNLSEVVLSYVSMCGVRAWDEYGGRMIEIFGDGQSIQSLYIKNDSRQEIADLILGRDGAR